jgi:hypothetical protein
MLQLKYKYFVYFLCVVSLVYVFLFCLIEAVYVSLLYLENFFA